MARDEAYREAEQRIEAARHELPLGEAGRNNAAVVPLDLEGYYSNFQLLVVHGRGTRCCAPTGLLYSIQVKTAIKSS